MGNSSNTDFNETKQKNGAVSTICKIVMCQTSNPRMLPLQPGTQQGFVYIY